MEIEGDTMSSNSGVKTRKSSANELFECPLYKLIHIYIYNANSPNKSM